MQNSVGIWMYSNDNGRVVQEHLVGELKSRGYRVVNDFDMRRCYTLNGRVYTEDNIDLSALDVLYHMNADQQNDYQRNILKSIELSGVKVFNSFSSFSTAQDKYFANLILRRHGVNVPDSMLIHSGLTEKTLRAKLKGWSSFVFKPRLNHGGNGIVKFDNSEGFLDFYQATKNSFDNYYLEKYIDFGAHDYRVEIFDGEVVGGYGRRVGRHSFKTNVSSGGEMMPVPASKEAEDLALKASSILGITTTIVDMLRSSGDGRLYLLEVNPIMGIFAEAGLRGGSKTPVFEEVHPDFCYDNIKLAAIIRHIEKLCGKSEQDIAVKKIQPLNHEGKL